MEMHFLRTDPYIAGVEVAVDEAVPQFLEANMDTITIFDIWWGILGLTREDYDAVTYAAYTAVAPPAADRIMFSACGRFFKCGAALWWGAMWAYLNPVGSVVRVA